MIVYVTVLSLNIENMKNLFYLESHHCCVITIRTEYTKICYVRRYERRVLAFRFNTGYWNFFPTE